MDVSTIKGLREDRSYLIKTEKGHILVDIGWPSIARRILEKYQDIYLIVITHRHYDHYGAAQYVKAKTGAKIAASESKSKRLIELPSLPTLLPVIIKSWIRQGCFLPKWEDLRIKFKLKGIDIILKEDEYIDEDKKLRVILTPGHTRDSICIYNSEEKILFSGDTLLNQFGEAHWANLVTDKKALEETKKKLSVLDIRFVFPGHGNPFEATPELKRILFPDLDKKK